MSLKSRRFQFGNVTHALDPFGAVEFPKHQAELRGRCDLADPTRRWSIVSGYALDTGVQKQDTGVGYVELLLDGALFANSNRDCFRLTDFNLPVNCYGLRRHDLVRRINRAGHQVAGGPAPRDVRRSAVMDAARSGAPRRQNAPPRRTRIAPRR